MDKKAVKTVKAPSAIGPYSQGVCAGGMLYTSGQLGVDMSTGELACGIEAQARAALTNLSAIIAEAGGSMGSVVRTLVFLSDMNDFAAFNKIYAGFFSEPYPARSCVQAAALPKGGLVEIEAIVAL